MNKKCNNCNLNLPFECFGNDASKKDGKRSTCKSCRNEREAMWQDRTRQRNRKWLEDQKNKPCSDCGGKFPSVCMDFDHLDNKEEIVSKLLWANVSKERILTEIAKCELICANCHRIRTFLTGRNQCGSPRKYDRSGWTPAQGM